MADTQRNRTIANPAKRRKLSDKQIAIFGSSAQKAALKRRRAAARGGAKTKSNKGGHKKRSRPVKRNPGQEIIGFTLAGKSNPGRKGGRKMATKAKTSKKRKSTSAKKRAGYGLSKYQPNPGHRHHAKRRRHNVGGSMVTSVGGLVTNALFVIAGALGSKLLAQMVLGSNNTGFMGYGGNIIAGAGLWFLADRVLKNRQAAAGVAAGTAVQVVLRLINDYTPFGQYVANLGMGDYQAQAFVTPQVLRDPFNSAEINIPGAWRPAPALPAPSMSVPGAVAAGVGSYGGGNLYGGGSNLY